MSNYQQNMMLNRLKTSLAEQGKTNRWLLEKLLDDYLKENIIVF